MDFGTSKYRGNNEMADFLNNIKTRFNYLIKLQKDCLLFHDPSFENTKMLIFYRFSIGWI